MIPSTLCCIARATSSGLATPFSQISSLVCDRIHGIAVCHSIVASANNQLRSIKKRHTSPTILEPLTYSSQIWPLESFRKLEFVLVLVQSLSQYRYIYREKDGFVPSSCTSVGSVLKGWSDHSLTFSTFYRSCTRYFISNHRDVHKVRFASVLSYHVFEILCFKH